MFNQIIKRLKPKKDKRPRWIIMGIIAIAIKMLTGSTPYFIENFYSNFIFKGFRFISDHSIAYFGFPFIFLAVPFMLFIIFKVYKNNFNSSGNLIGILFNFLYSTLASLMWLVFWFTILWGLNYNRPPIHDKLELKTVPISASYLKNELIQRDSILEQTRNLILSQNQSITEKDLPSDLEDQVRRDLMKAMSDIGYDVYGKMRIRQLPKGWLLRIATAGFYFPYTGEGHIDRALHPLQKPFTMAHEMAHGYGIGDEGTCNFLAYAACRNSSNPIIRYSGLLSFWRYLVIDYKRDRFVWDDYKIYREKLPKGIITDLDEINLNNEKYPDIFPKLREQTYDAYLKAQGVNEGIESYGMVVGLVLSWEDDK